MRPRRPVKTHSGFRRVAQEAALRGPSDLNELSKLLADIRVRLTRLSQGNGASMDFRFRNSLPHTRPNRSPARVEAEALYRLVQTGKNSVNDIRNLITVPPRLEQEARNLASANAAERKRLLAGLEFRKRVRAEFENLLADELAAQAQPEAPEGAEVLATTAAGQ